jgi:hypothetical protein
VSVQGFTPCHCMVEIKPGRGDDACLEAVAQPSFRSIESMT